LTLTAQLEIKKIVTVKKIDNVSILHFAEISMYAKMIATIKDI